MQEVAVVIPIYKINPSEADEVSLQRAADVLADYPTVFVCSEDLITDVYEKIIPSATVKRFPNAYFQSIEGYSELLLSPDFYRQFLDYEYILIYQTDAYVFRDELSAWCKKGYDYVGAPWIQPPPLANGRPKVNIQKWFVGRVGNGGFSLRKVKSHYNNTRFFRPILRFFVKNEDMFWGLFLYWLNPFFRRPSWREALDFAFELNPREAYELTHHQLPFGVHAWEKYDKTFWEGFIP